jgi:hypothetical protein
MKIPIAVSQCIQRFIGRIEPLLQLIGPVDMKSELLKVYLKER